MPMENNIPGNCIAYKENIPGDVLAIVSGQDYSLKYILIEILHQVIL